MRFRILAITAMVFGMILATCVGCRCDRKVGCRIPGQRRGNDDHDL